MLLTRCSQFACRKHRGEDRLETVEAGLDFGGVRRPSQNEFLSVQHLEIEDVSVQRDDEKRGDRETFDVALGASIGKHDAVLRHVTHSASNALAAANVPAGVGSGRRFASHRRFAVRVSALGTPD